MYVFSQTWFSWNEPMIIFESNKSGATERQQAPPCDFMDFSPLIDVMLLHYTFGTCQCSSQLLFCNELSVLNLLFEALNVSGQWMMEIGRNDLFPITSGMKWKHHVLYVGIRLFWLPWSKLQSTDEVPYYCHNPVWLGLARYTWWALLFMETNSLCHVSSGEMYTMHMLCCAAQLYPFLWCITHWC